MNKKLEKKLAKLPTSPGVYFHKNAAGEIIYIGKAANLRNRVRQYFQASRFRDPKTDLLVNEIADVDWTELETEVDALFLEAEMVRRYMPPYNILLRDDKSQLYIRIDYKSDFPTLSFTRRPLDDGANYFGPYFHGFAVKKALRYLRRAFPYATHRTTGQKRPSLHYHLGLDPGLEDGRTSLANYRANLRKIMQYLRGQRVTLVQAIERDMKKAAAAQDFEKAAALRNQLSALQQLSRQSLFGDKERLDASSDQALVELADLLNLAKPPRRIEGYDISHLQGTDNVASMVVFLSGLPDKAAYRKFKMRAGGNDDFAHLEETLRRRLREENLRKWGTPDLIIVDGGKGQLKAALAAREACQLNQIPMVGLAKRREEIIIHKADSITGVEVAKIIAVAQKSQAYISESTDFLSILLPENSLVVKLLQRIRDESHRFATAYHTILQRRRQTASVLDDIPGIGPVTRKKLVRQFGSVRAASQATEAQLQTALGKQKGALLARFLTARRPL
jgi:excinuclease ABC subunit C